MSTIRRFDWSRENIRHTGITLAFVGLPVPTLVIIVEYVSYNSVLNHFNLVQYSLPRVPKESRYSTRGRILFTVWPFFLSKTDKIRFAHYRIWRQINIIRYLNGSTSSKFVSASLKSFTFGAECISM